MFHRLLRQIADWPRPTKRLVQIAFDVMALAFSVWLAFALRFGPQFTPNLSQMALIAVAPFLAIPVFVRLGLYRAILRYLPDRAFWTIAQAVGLSTLLFILVVFLAELGGGQGAPRSIPLLYGLIAMAVIGGSRFLARALLSLPKNAAKKKTRALIYGAGNAGTQLAMALRSADDRRVVGFLDDNPAVQGLDVMGLRVWSPQDLDRLIETKRIEEVILCLPSAGAMRRLEISGWLSDYPVQQRILPAITDLAAGKYTINHVKEISIEDLLGRTRVVPDPTLMEAVIQDKTVMITGAGGSIGSELCRLVAANGPSQIVLVDASETALYEIDRQLRRDWPDVSCEAMLRSVADSARMDDLFDIWQVDVIFHAAAYKHVPLLEDNPLEGIGNNVLGTLNVAEAAFRSGVGHFVLISTDKAVRPSNVMGATKRWSELILRHFSDLAEAEETGQHFLAVRFGNVLGSNGSVVPLFKEQIARGGPVTLTDDRMTRYFMAIPEAAELIVQAAALSEGGETFLLEMGEPIFIRTLAENMIRLAGLTVKSPDNPDGDIAIEVTGMRPGEKLNESLYYDPSLAKPTGHPKILQAKRRGVQTAPIMDSLDLLKAALAAGDADRAEAILFATIEVSPELKRPNGRLADLPRAERSGIDYA